MVKPKQAFWFRVTEQPSGRNARVKYWNYERARQFTRMFEQHDYMCGPIGIVEDGFTRDDAEIDLAVDFLEAMLQMEHLKPTVLLPTGIR